MMDSENHGQEVLSCLIGHEHLFCFWQYAPFWKCIDGALISCSSPK